ncbi:hypothetical protein J4417_01415 [Candidatus Woesearchaeota archaeon]|nr:hypothetical protein [Candidatus Woesearchaeota archaeon]
MDNREILELSGQLKPVFSIKELKELTGRSPATLKKSLIKLKQNHLIWELGKGQFAFPQDRYTLASNLLFPSYISFTHALYYHHLIEGASSLVYVASSKSKKDIALEGFTIKFLRQPSHRFFGYRKETFMGKDLFIAEKEKAIADALCFPEFFPLKETKQALAKGLDLGRLSAYALRNASSQAIKRLGYLLETLNLNLPQELKEKVTKKYDLLNPAKEKAGEKNKTWKLILNEQLE